MTPIVKEIFHPEYGKCVHVIAGPVTALVTIDQRPPDSILFLYGTGKHIVYGT